jgi:hypothetical protein
MIAPRGPGAPAPAGRRSLPRRTVDRPRREPPPVKPVRGCAAPPPDTPPRVADAASPRLVHQERHQIVEFENKRH